MANAWTNHKYKAKIYVKQYVDMETGEIITEEEFIKNYTKTKLKNEYTTKYTRHARVTTATIKCRKRAEQGTLF